MKKKWIVLALGIIGIPLFLVYRYFTYDIQFNNGSIHYETTSPSGNYTARVYYDYYGGAAGGVNLYVNVVSHDENDTEKTVYYSDAESNVQINWLDDNNLSIENESEYTNNSIVLKVGEEIYDETGRACNKYKAKKYICYSRDAKK